jgi:hypothetical protein
MTDIDIKLLQIEVKCIRNFMKTIEDSETHEERTTIAFQILEYLTDEPREILKNSRYKDTVNERVNYWNLEYPNQGFEKYN